jgi:mannosyltransferase OCH1-like enzyme
MMCVVVVAIFLIACACLSASLVSAEITLAGYQLPVLPTNVDPAYDPAKTIPCDIYMTQKDPSKIDDDFLPFIKKNSDCVFKWYDDAGMDAFFAHEFANTSLAWAYSVINPKLMASKADLWRMAALWYYGGVYMDADSFLNTKLTEVIKPSDRFVFGAENNAYQYCYGSQYHLNQTSTTQFAEGKQLVNWLVMSSRRHPFVTQLLHNVVMLIKRQYFEEKYLYDIEREPFFKIICTTGPGAMTASLSEVISNASTIRPVVRLAIKASNDYLQANNIQVVNDDHNDYTNLDFKQFRYAGVDWKQYGGMQGIQSDAYDLLNEYCAGVFKTWGNWRTNKLYSDKPHYQEVMKHGGTVLEKYAKDEKYFVYP